MDANLFRLRAAVLATTVAVAHVGASSAAGPPLPGNPNDPLPPAKHSLQVLSVAQANGPTTPLLDDFNRPDGPLSQNGEWAVSDPQGGIDVLEVSSLQAASPHRPGPAISYRAETFAGDQEAYATVATKPPVGQQIGLGLNLRSVGSPAWDGYLIVWRPLDGVDLLVIEKIADNGVAAVVATTNVELASGDRLLARNIGPVIEVLVHQSGAWRKVLEGSDAAYRGGRVAAHIFRSGARLDDFGGGVFVPPAPEAIPPEQTFGVDEDGSGIHGESGTGLFADPVNSRTGAFTTAVDDVALPGTGVSLSWRRTYTSADVTVGRLGPGWTDSYSAALEVQPNGDVRLHGEDGQQLHYTRLSNGSFAGAPGSRSTLASVAGGYELVRIDQVRYRFDALGRLLSMKDRNGQGVTLSYSQDRLSSVTDAAGRQLQLNYNAQNLVDLVQTPDGRGVTFQYTGGHLTSVIDVRGNAWRYTYDAGGRLATMVDPLGHAHVTNVYGDDGRVQSQRDALQKTTTFAWNDQAETATATDANQKVWTHDYDDGVLAHEIDPLTNETDLVRDSDLNTTSVTGPTGATTTMTYDAAGNLLTATAPPSLGSATKTFVYNGRNDPTQITDARGKVTSYAYDADGNLVTVTQDGTRIASYTYDTAGRVTTYTDGNEKTFTYTYVPATGYLASSADSLGNTTRYTYDAAGRVATRVDPKGNVTGCNCATDFTWTYSYNAAGELLTERNPLGHTTTNVYDDAGRLTSTTDALGRTTSYSYDAANRVLTETSPDPDGGGPLTAPVTAYTYDDVGNKLTETDPRGNTTRFSYDAANRLVSTTGPDPDGAGPQAAPVTTQTYDANGNLTGTVEPRGNAPGASPDEFRTSFTYDASGRLLTTTDPLGHVTTNVYDPVGNLRSVRDGNGHTTTYTYDAAGRTLTVTAPDLGVTTYTYDDAGNLRTRQDGNGQTTTFAYDDAGRLVSETGPDPDGPGPQGAAVTSYTYDANDNRLTRTDPNGNATPASGDGMTSYGYDRANRQTSIDYSDATPDVTFTLDAVGNRIAMVDGSGTETRTYDNLDRLLRVTRGSDTFSYVYDAVSNVTRRTYPGNTVVAYTFDALDRLTSATSSSQTTSYGYDLASNLVQTALPAGNGYVETRAYDRAGRLTEVANRRGSTTLSRFAATLDAVGNPTRVDRTGALTQTEQYSYDALDRLMSSWICAPPPCSETGNRTEWTYDAVGNRLTQAVIGSPTLRYTYNAADQLLTIAESTSESGVSTQVVPGPKVTVRYTYDRNGNQISGPASTTFAYDLANRLTTRAQGNQVTNYGYDGDGKRVRAGATNVLWDVNQDLPQMAIERDGSVGLLRRYLYGLRRISMTANGATSYYHYDRLGSAVNLTSSAGATRWTYAYDPFGTLRTEAPFGSVPTNFMKFAGEYLDPTGLYHLRARQYDPTQGRFIQVDPEAPDPAAALIATYVYAANRPGVLVDPAGAKPKPTGLFHTFVSLSTEPAAPTCLTRTLAQREKCAYDFFVARGLTRAQAAGCVGNLWFESGGNLNPRQWQFGCHPRSWHDSNCGVGIAQWTVKERKERLLQFAGSVPRALKFDVQLAFVWHELRTGIGPADPNALRNLKAVSGASRSAVYRATAVFMEDYEAPGVPHLRERQRKAWEVYRRLAG
jgi:RHS repeat-associated protein